MAVFPPHPGGCLMSAKDNAAVSDRGVHIYLDCEPGIDAALARIEKSGGAIVVPKTALPPGLGLFAHVRRQRRRPARAGLMGAGMSDSARNWFAVASAQHARLGPDHAPMGFMQVGHGRHAPLKRVAPGDRVAYYSPSAIFGGTDKLRSFVSIGVVQPGEPYQVIMGEGFAPWRRDVRYAQAQEAPILPLIESFEFVDDPKHWGYKFRFGLFDVIDHDMRLIADAMNAGAAALVVSWPQEE